MAFAAFYAQESAAGRVFAVAENDGSHRTYFPARTGALAVSAAPIGAIPGFGPGRTDRRPVGGFGFRQVFREGPGSRRSAGPSSSAPCLRLAAPVLRDGARRRGDDRQTIAARIRTRFTACAGRTVGRSTGPVALRARGCGFASGASSFGAAVATGPARQIGSVGSRRPGIGLSPTCGAASRSFGDRGGGEAGSVGSNTGCGSGPARGDGLP